MCGHGTIGAVTAALEEGFIVPREEGLLAIEAPAGRVAIEYKRKGHFVEQVRLFNVDSYLHAADIELEIPGLGALKIDLAYGGNYFVIIEPQPNWTGLEGMPASEIVRLSPTIRRVAQAKLAPVHPEDERIRGVSHVMWCDMPRNSRADARNAVFYGERAIDRPDRRHGWRSWPPGDACPSVKTSSTRASSELSSSAASRPPPRSEDMPRSSQAWPVGRR
jgi:4-hydroxyproline epimerase